MLKRLLSVVLVGVMALSLVGFNWFGGGGNKTSNYKDSDFKDYCYCYFDGNNVLHFTSNESKGEFCFGKYWELNIRFLDKNLNIPEPSDELYNYLWQYHHGNNSWEIEEVTIDDKILINFGGLFANYKILKKINNIENLVTTNLDNMFASCKSLESLDLSKMDVSHVKLMRSTFDRCTNLKSLNVSTWNTSNVKDMSGMFSYCEKLTSLDLSNFDTSNVNDMSTMFLCCRELIILNTTNWDVSNVRNISEMFNCCSEFKDDCSIDVSNLKFPQEVGYDKTLFQNSSVKADWWDKGERKIKK